MPGPEPLTEREINEALVQFWAEHAGVCRAPTVHDIWMEQERVAELDVQVLPTKREVIAHFAWFFSEAA